MQRAVELAQILEELTAELQALGLWELQPPSPQALASTEPFCVDTLNFSQWLQWVMLPRFEQMLAEDAPLPQNCSIHPFAEEAFKEHPADTRQLLLLIERIDLTLTVHH